MGTYQGNEFTRNSSGNARPQSSQIAEPLWTDPGPRSEIGVCEVICSLKKKIEECCVGPSSQILAHDEKAITSKEGSVGLISPSLQKIAKRYDSWGKKTVILCFRHRYNSLSLFLGS